jgi:hypothetical protein
MLAEVIPHHTKPPANAFTAHTLDPMVWLVLLAFSKKYMKNKPLAGVLIA